MKHLNQYDTTPQILKRMAKVKPKNGVAETSIIEKREQNVMTIYGLL